MFRPSRSVRGEDRYFHARMALFLAGAACGLAGMAFDAGWLVTTGIVILAVAMILGIIARGKD